MSAERPIPSLKTLQLAQAVIFLLVGIAQAGLIVPDYSRPLSALATAAIGALLLVGWRFSLTNPLAAHQVAVVVQSIALLGSLFGAALLWLGVGPRTMVDLIVQNGLLIVAIAGLVSVMRVPPYPGS